jgi:hypothetical protein
MLKMPRLLARTRRKSPPMKLSARYGKNGPTVRRSEQYAAVLDRLDKSRGGPLSTLEGISSHWL